MPPTDASMPRRVPKPLSVALLASVATAMLMIGILVSEGSLKVMNFRPYAGSLVVFSDAVWKAPSGENVQGLISYEPVSGNVSYLIPPDSQNASVIIPGMYSDNRVLVVQRSASTTNLVSLDLGTKTASKIATLSDEEGAFGQALWSSDGSRIAYVIYRKTGAPSLHITGVPPKDLAFAIPLAFSPDASELIVDARPMLRWINATTGTGGILEGIAFTSPNQAAQISPNGNFILTTQDGEPVAKVYRIDWQTHTVTPDGMIPAPAKSSVVFNTNNQVLITTAEGLSKAYQLSADGVHTQIGLFNFRLPESVRIISWNAP